MNDAKGRLTKIAADSNEIAPYKSKSTDFEWRMHLDVGMVVDVQDSFGGWYQGTIVEVKVKSTKKNE
jgi:hypothetical protein